MYLEKAVDDILVLLYHTLEKIGDADYTKPCTELQEASIGQHYRHVIEMFDCLLNGYQQGEVSYDSRKRDKQIEQNRQSAIRAIKKLEHQFLRPDKHLQLAASFSITGETEYFSTTYYRELAYTLEHAVHHMAIIKIALQLMLPGLKLPDNFGVAIATLKHKNACAQ